MNKKVGITEVVLRDGNQSLLSTRLKLEDLIPIASNLDDIGYSSIESWGGAIFDSCVRYLDCLLYTSPSPRDQLTSRMPSSA